MWIVRAVSWDYDHMSDIRTYLFDNMVDANDCMEQIRNLHDEVELVTPFLNVWEKPITVYQCSASAFDIERFSYHDTVMYAAHKPMDRTTLAVSNYQVLSHVLTVYSDISRADALAKLMEAYDNLADELEKYIYIGGDVNQYFDTAGIIDGYINLPYHKRINVEKQCWELEVVDKKNRGTGIWDGFDQIIQCSG